MPTWSSDRSVVGTRSLTLSFRVLVCQGRDAISPRLRRIHPRASSTYHQSCLDGESQLLLASFLMISNLEAQAGPQVNVCICSHALDLHVSILDVAHQI